MRRVNRLASLALLAVLACLPSPGPFTLDAVRGQVRTKEAGEAVAGAVVVQVFRGAATPGATQPVYHSRWTVSDDEGRFAFPEASAPSLRMWLLETYAPTYELYHEAYGLQRDRDREGEELVLRISADRAAQAQDDLAAYCREGRDDPGALEIATRACRARPRRP